MAKETINPKDSVGSMRGGLPWPFARAMRALPLAPLELAANGVMRTILTRNSGMFSRLGAYAHKRFAVDPVDCPFVFVLEPRPLDPRLRVLSSIEEGTWDARIAGAMVVLAGLLDGTYDGDALFFTRDLVIEGDTAAVLALRNAIEDADLDPGRLLGIPDRIAPVVSEGVRSMSEYVRSLLGAPAGSYTTSHDSF